MSDSSMYHSGLEFPKMYEKYLIEISNDINRLKHEYDIRNIVFSGISGMRFGFAVCALTGLRPVVVRKKYDRSNGQKVEGKINGNYCVLDDFIESGKTMYNIAMALGKESAPEFIYLYNEANTRYKRYCGVPVKRLHSRVKDKFAMIKQVIQDYEKELKNAKRTKAPKKIRTLKASLKLEEVK